MYHGGTEGASLITWHRVSDDTTIEIVSTERTFKPTGVDIGYHIRVTYLPVRSDGLRGQAKCCTVGPVIPCEPCITSLEFIGDTVEGSQITVQRTYIGGREGESKFSWLRVLSSEESEMIPCPSADVYVPTFHDIGHHIAYEYTPMREDGVTGQRVFAKLEEPVEMAYPQCTHLEIEKTHEGFVASPQYIGGKPGEHLYSWYRCKEEIEEEIPSATAAVYRPHYHETGCQLRVAFTPVREDGAIGERVVSQLSETISYAGVAFLSCVLIFDCRC